MEYMSKDHRVRRAVNFDLNIGALKENYSETNPEKAYKEIRSFFEKNGFFHRQGSGYCSKDKMTDAELFKTMQKMFKALPWLYTCVKRMDATDIGKVYDIKAQMAEIGAKKNFRNNLKKTKQSEKKSVLKQLKVNKEFLKQREEKYRKSREKGEPNREER